jgi:hypothetical protein
MGPNRRAPERERAWPLVPPKEAKRAEAERKIAEAQKIIWGNLGASGGSAALVSFFDRHRINWPARAVDRGSVIKRDRQGVIMRIILAAFAVALLVGPAASQGMNLLDGNERKKTQEDADKEKAIEDAYKSTMKKLPDQKKATNDPWADVRGSSEPKAQKQGRPSSSNKAN